MRLLDRYLVRELLVPLGYCLSGFLLLWVVSDLVNELGSLQEHKLHALDIVEYYLVKAPEFLALVLPMALLLALLYALTNHARHNEITAIRAAGVSLWRLCLPYLAVGFVASLVLFTLNEFCVPDSDAAAEQIKNRRMAPAPDTPGRHQVRNLEFSNARAGRLWHIGVYDTRTSEMLNPQVIWTQPDGSRLWLYADRAVRRNNVWVFYNLSEYKEAARANSWPAPLLRTNALALPAFTETPEEIQSEIRISNSLSLRKARRADIPLTEIVNYLRLHPVPSGSDAAWLYTKLHGRLAAPWTCLVVVLIALPFGAASGRRNVVVGVASSLFICFSYFVLQQLCLALGTGAYVPPWLAGWFPNLAFGSVGLCLTARVR